MASYTAGAASKRADKHKEGNYLLAVIGAEEKTSGSGNEMIELKMEVIGPNIPEDEGAIVYDYLVFTENNAWKIDQFRTGIGETVTEGQEVEIEADDLIGKSAEAHLVVEEYPKKSGKFKNKVGDYIDPNQTDESGGEGEGEVEPF